MKKAELQLLKVASKFQKKYGQAQTLQQIIENAAGYGESSANGIMNFPGMLKEQKAQLGFTVEISSGMLGGSNISVSGLKGVDSNGVDITPQYAKLPDQVKKYLEKHISGFPQLEQGSTPLNWDYRASRPSIAGNL